MYHILCFISAFCILRSCKFQDKLHFKGQDKNLCSYSLFLNIVSDLVVSCPFLSCPVLRHVLCVCTFCRLAVAVEMDMVQKGGQLGQSSIVVCCCKETHAWFSGFWLTDTEHYTIQRILCPTIAWGHFISRNTELHDNYIYTLWYDNNNNNEGLLSAWCPGDTETPHNGNYKTIDSDYC